MPLHVFLIIDYGLCSLFRTLDLNTPLTAIAFSPEGASIYSGTGDGKLLIQDLRTLDKPVRQVVVSESGNAINSIAVQVSSF